jgi:hypothetical protein
MLIRRRYGLVKCLAQAAGPWLVSGWVWPGVPVRRVIGVHTVWAYNTSLPGGRWSWGRTVDLAASRVARTANSPGCSSAVTVTGRVDTIGPCGNSTAIGDDDIRGCGPLSRSGGVRNHHDHRYGHTPADPNLTYMVGQVSSPRQRLRNGRGSPPSYPNT